MIRVRDRRWNAASCGLTTYVRAALVTATLYGCAQRGPVVDTQDSTPPVPQSSAPPAAATAQERGRISMYGAEFSGRKTASGESFDPAALTMAHRTLPFGTRVRVTNLQNQRSVEVVVNDRGPFVAGRIADLSLAAARQIGMAADGVVEALLNVLQSPKP